MATVYQYNAAGYYTGPADDFGGAMPHNCCAIAPDVQEGFIPRWDGAAWEQVENHKGEEGYLDGQAHTIASYGPYPEGWSSEPPTPEPPTLAEARAQKWQQALQGYSAVFAKVDLMYPPQERETWRFQEAEALAYTAWLQAGAQGEAPVTPYLTGLVQLRGFGETVQSFAENVLQAQSIFGPLGIVMNGQQQRHYHQIHNVLQTVDDVLAYAPTYDLPPELTAYLGGENA